MALFAISDLHLSFGTDKPMNVFKGWENHTERLENAWRRVVGEDDTVVLGGDTSWALKTDDAAPDFKFIDRLPGKKILLKGNHDLWWPTVKKLREFFEKNDIKTVDILYNNSFSAGDYSICGSRGWLYDGSGEKDAKVIKRECGRIETSLTLGTKNGQIPILFLHYPPVYGDFVCEEIFSVIKRFGVKDVYYGHIHGTGLYNTVKEYDGVNFHLISCDCVDFTPVFVGHYI